MSGPEHYRHGEVLLQYLKMDLIAACMAVTTLFSLPTPAPVLAGAANVPPPTQTQAQPVFQPVAPKPLPVKKLTVATRIHSTMAPVLTKALSPLRLAGTGMASWYGSMWNGKKTASGETFDETLLTACHRTLPFGTKVKVTELRTGKSVIVKINDRGTMTPSRIIDLSSGAAKQLGILNAGVAKVKLEILDKVENPATVQKMPL
jgi:rare lipoprotein A